MRRSAIILLVIFVLLAALTWAMQQPENPISKALATSTAEFSGSYEALVSPNSGEISRIVISDGAGKTVTLEKNSGTWTVNGSPADQTGAETAASMALSMQIVTSLTEAPDPAGTGLNTPAYSATITTASGIVSIKIGKLAPTGSGYYVQTGDGKVLIIDQESLDSFIGILQNPPVQQTSTPQS